MNWFKIAQSEKEKEVAAFIKDKVRNHKFFISLMDLYQVPEEDVEHNLEILFSDLEGKFAEGNGKEIKIDKSLLDENILQENFHFVVHEFFHWVKRRSEALFYFNDDEEVQAFSLAMAWEKLNGKSEKQIFQLFYPIIKGHFEDEENALKTTQKMLEHARKITDRFS